MDRCRRTVEGGSSAPGRQIVVASAAAPGRRATLVTALLVSLSALLVYLPALGCGFVNWDDNLYVYENPLVQRLNASLLRGAFLGFTAGNWHPLTMLSHALDCALWGVKPLGHHLTSLLLHTVNTFLAVLVVERLGRFPGWRSGASNDPTAARGGPRVLCAAALTGLLFGLHPLHVESVAWISERKDLLCAMFYLLSLLAYAAYATVAGDAVATDSRFLRDRRYLGALVLFALALMSKPMAVSLPAVLLVLDYCPFRRVRNGTALGAAAIEKLPFFLLGLTASVLTILAQRASHAVVSLEAMPYAERLIVAVRSVGFYLGKILLPLNLVPFYVYPRQTAFVPATTGLFVVVIIGATIVTIVAARRGNRLWLAAWCWYGLTLAPVLGVVQVGGQAMADRYTYLPSLGPFLILGAALAWSWGRLGALRGGRVAARAALCTAVVGALSVLAALTVRQTAIWRDSVTLWSALIAREPMQPGFVYYNRASAYQGSGKFLEALVDYSKAIERDPRDGEFYFGRAYVLEKSRRWAEALADYGKAIELSPGDQRLFESRGRLLAGTGQIAAAAADFEFACRLGSDFGCTAAQFYRTSGAKLQRP